MKETIVKHYCDYCGKLIKHRPKTVYTVWEVIFNGWRPGTGYMYEKEYGKRIDGDGCEACYKSFLRWKKSRRKCGE